MGGSTRFQPSRHSLPSAARTLTSLKLRRRRGAATIFARPPRRLAVIFISTGRWNCVVAREISSLRAGIKRDVDHTFCPSNTRFFRDGQAFVSLLITRCIARLISLHRAILLPFYRVEDGGLVVMDKQDDDYFECSFGDRIEKLKGGRRYEKSYINGEKCKENDVHRGWYRMLKEWICLSRFISLGKSS